MKKPRKNLKAQCDEIGIGFIEIELDYSGRPEQALLTFFQEKGFVGATAEGGTILTFLKACFLDKLSEYNYFSSRSDACSRYLEAQFTILKDSIDVVINSIDNLTREIFIANAKEILDHPFIKSIYPDLRLDILIELYSALDLNTVKKIAYKLAENPYSYRSGWPDLVIAKENVLQFIEVKTTDKLHNSQLYTIPVMKEIIPFEFLVYRLKKII